MKGVPNSLNTRCDYEYLRNNFTPADWRPRFRELLVGRYVWQISGQLAAAADGVDDDTHRVQIEADESGTETIYQMELVEDPNAVIFKLGYTVAEVERILAG